MSRVFDLFWSLFSVGKQMVGYVFLGSSMYESATVSESEMSRGWVFVSG